MTDFKEDSVFEGLRYGEFYELPETTRRKIVKLLARVSEQSFRFEPSLSKSYGLDDFRSSSEERLRTEIDVCQVGL